MTAPTPFRLRAAAAAVALLALAGCSSGDKIGTGVKLGSGGNANLALGGSATPTPTATAHHARKHKPKPSRVQATVTSRPAATAQPAQTQAAAQPKAKPFTITINGDASGQPALSPPDAAVYVGTEIVWVNHDTQPRSVLAQDGSFRSPPIAPGKSYSWIAKSAGRHNYQDGTRPYVDGQIQVYPR